MKRGYGIYIFAVLTVVDRLVISGGDTETPATIIQSATSEETALLTVE